MQVEVLQASIATQQAGLQQSVSEHGQDRATLLQEQQLLQAQLTDALAQAARSASEAQQERSQLMAASEVSGLAEVSIFDSLRLKNAAEDAECRRLYSSFRQRT